ncbi:unnamed protein product, partial [Phaeothamnion confervicola]
AVGFVLIVSSLYLFIAMFSYLFTGKADQSVVEGLGQSGLIESGIEAENWLGLYGAITSQYFIYRWFGIAAFLIPPIFFLLGFKMAFKRTLFPIFPVTIFSVFAGLWLSLLFGYLTLSVDGVTEWSFLGGGLGYNLALVSHGLLGWGTFLLLVLSLFIFIIFFFNVTAINAFQVKDPKPMGNDAILATDTPAEYLDEKDKWVDPKNDIIIPEPIVLVKPPEPKVPVNEMKLELEKQPEPKKEKQEPVFIVEEPVETDALADKLVEEKGLYDPTLDLSGYKFPPLELLNEYEVGKVQVTQEELNQNKDKILATLTNFKIGITSIKATIGPTVTLYEIVPDAGIKISRIKNLEDDIALSLAALGIRIIAPIPGKGTIGIEVPNKNREMVSIRSVLASPGFQKTDKELPIAIGKTISNEVLVIDLAKMPHLLVAG